MIAQMAKMIQWIIDTAQERGEKILFKPVKGFSGFSHLFQRSLNVNLVRASCLWKCRQQVLDRDGNVKTTGVSSCIRRFINHGVKQFVIKDHNGRRKKRTKWVDGLHMELRDELDRMRKFAVKFILNTLRLLLLHILHTNNNGTYEKGFIDTKTGLRQEQLINSASSHSASAFKSLVALNAVN